jgi:ABC-2 type transport system permease protein
MNLFFAAFRAEALKARRSKITLLSFGGFSILPLVGGLFMIILKDPDRARALGLISTKAELTAGTADWSSLFQMLAQGTAVGGAIMFALITTWVFGREFSDHTAKELMALPTPRVVIVTAKFALAALWTAGLTLWIFLVGLAVGAMVDIPGWSVELATNRFTIVLLTALTTLLLMPFVALVASLGRGYLPPMGWTFLALAFASILSVLGWGDRFPWAVPMLVSGMGGEQATPPGLFSYAIVLVTGLAGTVATMAWWQTADQTR